MSYCCYGYEISRKDLKRCILSIKDNLTDDPDDWFYEKHLDEYFIDKSPLYYGKNDSIYIGAILEEGEVSNLAALAERLTKIINLLAAYEDFNYLTFSSLRVNDYPKLFCFSRWY